MQSSRIISAAFARPVHRPRPKLRVEALDDRLAPAVFTVTGINDSGVGTLRQAILDANAAPGADQIAFAIAGGGVKTINITSPLPPLTGPTLVDGNTQNPNSAVPLIELSGAFAGAGANGLILKAAGSTVRDLVINNFSGNGVLILGVNAVVEGCYIGTNNAGSAVAANQLYGVLITGTAKNVRIGGTTPAARNVISGNGLSGVAILGAQTSANKVQGNIIGADAAGTVDLGNGLDGVLIAGGSRNNLVGGEAAALNVISGNGAHGVEVSGAGTKGNKIQRNYIGMNLGGNAALGNSLDGVHIGGGASGNLIGGDFQKTRNVISTNAGSGVTLTGAGTTGNFVKGNAFGTNDIGFNLALGNGIGISVASGAGKNTIGGTVAAAGNLINSSTTAGLRITGAGTSGNLVQGNIIGLRFNGSAKRSNNTGVEVSAGATGNVIGGLVAGARNVISGNSNIGVDLNGNGTNGNLVQGNFIGTGLTGTESALGNGTGVAIRGGASNNTIGGAANGARNIISGNSGNGIDLVDPGVSPIRVQGNFIGLNAAGTGSLGNGGSGVRIGQGISGVIVGGTVPLARNVISGNGKAGVQISDAAGTSSKIQGNFIGTLANGSGVAGNVLHGVVIFNGAHDHLIGGTVVGAGNVIANNGGDGVLIGSDAANGFTNDAGIGNSVLGNRIFANAGQGIDLGANDGPTANDVNDSDNGPNALINTPVLTSAILAGNSLAITGLINTESNKVLRIEFFASPSSGQSQVFLGFLTRNIGSSNTVVFTKSLTVAAALVSGQTLTATATDELGNTSEFSLGVTIV